MLEVSGLEGSRLSIIGMEGEASPRIRVATDDLRELRVLIALPADKSPRDLVLEEFAEAIEAGDYLVFPPGEAHQIINNGSEDLIYIVIADQPQADVIHYPDSGKWMTKPQRKCFEMTETDYFKGEE